MVALAVVIAGTIGNYSDLRDKVALYLDRDDLNGRIPDFVALMEARANRLLRSVNQETRVLWTISSESWALPADYRKMRKLHIEGHPDRPLREISPQSSAMEFGGAAGTPQAYYFEGRTMTLVPPPSTATTFSATYWTRIYPLTSDNDSNWLLEEHPDIYLFGTLFEAAVYIRDDDAMSYCDAKFTEALAELKAESLNDRYGGGPLAPNGPRQVRGAPC